MTYALLWIEILISSLLWSAMWLVLAYRTRRRWVGAVAILIALIPLAKLIAPFVASSFMKFYLDMESNWFYYFASLLLTAFIGIVALIIRGRRKSPASGERAAKFWPVGELALGMVVAVALTVLTFWNIDEGVRGQFEALRKEAGELMLAAAPPCVNDSQNAALVYQAAFARLANDKLLEESGEVLASTPPDSNNRNAMALLDRHQATIELLRTAGAMPNCRFEHDYSRPTLEMLFPEVGRSRTAARLLWLHARSEKSKGNIESAIADITAMCALSRAIGGNPTIVSLLVSAGIDAMAAEVLAEVLPAVTRPQQLSGLRIGDNSQFPHMFARALQGEQAMGFGGFCDVASGETSVDDVAGISKGHQAPWGPPGRMALRVFLLSDDAAHFRQIMERYRQAAVQPWYENPTRTEDRATFRRAGILTSILTPFLSHMIVFSARGQATHAECEVAIAMTRYRLDHGSYPERLDALIPTYLHEIPPDPFDGKPLRLAHTVGEWIIYSIGQDGTDDGGAPFDTATKKGDFGLTLKMPN